MRSGGGLQRRLGIADEWRGDARDASEWRDNHFRVTGPAVDGLLGAFVHNWAESGHSLFDAEVDRFPTRQACGRSPVQVVRSGARTGWGEMSTLVWSFLTLARHRLRIAAAYFVPDDEMLAFLCATARRGVRIDLLVNGPHADKRLSRVASEAHYETLLEAGVNVWCFQPTMLHVKSVTVDGAVASVGSANFNSRSFLLDEEVNLVVFDPETVATLDSYFDEDLERSEGIDSHRWAARSQARKALEVVPGFLSRHL